MSKCKKISAEEKRNRILQIFHDSQDFFQLKEIEKISSKEKGINVQYVKDIVQNLVDDGLVDSDKIGTSLYYWSYPNKTLINKRKMLEEITLKTEDVVKKLKFTKERLEQEKVGKKESEEKLNLLDEIKTLEKCREELLEKCQIYKDNDSEMLDEMKNNTKILMEAANKWTENIFMIKSWCKNKFQIDENVLDKQFEIPVDLDYIDLK
ncbi:hypothetical protein PGB90_008307 [Kerria lacca]